MSKVKLLLKKVGMWPRSHPLISCQLPVVFCGTAASDAIKACCYLFFSYSSVSKASPPEPKEPACPPLCACWFPCLFSFFTQQVLTSEGAFCPREGEEPPPPPEVPEFRRHGVDTNICGRSLDVSSPAQPRRMSH